ncbi:hypothetical protein [Nocardia donostiensis]|uniref:Outer membrane channel protein CpnT-like N-terminal domain-containing protein n=1 Tax=Nocardia donostiensis TaxID=1538463 RepID=A0A1W0B822_9NOCA|nr:hypothetical protein [Nocardia donostiensis]ONM46356.1 hypothetical protein B0T46_23525 [Nocardia donostiensis]OQS16677.1 hypothetical protein B0T36_03115 [Nocardia donostiensis]OQS18673.1 hypothetical protein B0T44_18415 [Nocardia donostiensis]
MPIEIPSEVVVFLNYLGVPYPDINEDDVRALAEHVRTFADSVQQTHESATGAINEMGSVYSGYSYQALIAAWASMSSSHMERLDMMCRAVATALEVAADVITVVKAVVLAELAALAAAYMTAMAAAVATGGASAALAQTFALAARRLCSAMQEMLIAYVLAEVLGKAIEPLEQAVADMVNGVVYDLASDALDVSPNSAGPLTIDPDEVMRYADVLDKHADDILEHAKNFSDNVSALDFTTRTGFDDPTGVIPPGNNVPAMRSPLDTLAPLSPQTPDIPPLRHPLLPSDPAGIEPISAPRTLSPGISPEPGATPTAPDGPTSDSPGGSTTPAPREPISGEPRAVGGSPTADAGAGGKAPGMPGVSGASPDSAVAERGAVPERGAAETTGRGAGIDSPTAAGRTEVAAPSSGSTGVFHDPAQAVSPDRTQAGESGAAAGGGGVAAPQPGAPISSTPAGAPGASSSPWRGGAGGSAERPSAPSAPPARKKERRDASRPAAVARTPWSKAPRQPDVAGENAQPRPAVSAPEAVAPPPSSKEVAAPEQRVRPPWAAKGSPAADDAEPGGQRPAVSVDATPERPDTGAAPKATRSEN